MKQQSCDTNVSVVIPWRDRPELEGTLAQNAPEFESVGADVLVVNCAGDAAALTAAIGRSGCPRVRQIDIPAPRFNKCLAQNIGVHLCRGGVVFMLDTDMVLDAGFLAAA